MCSLLYDATYVLRIGVVDASMTMGMWGGGPLDDATHVLRIGVVDISMTRGGGDAARRHVRATHRA